MRILVLDIKDDARAMLSARVEEALRQAGVRRVEIVESDPGSLSSLAAEEPPDLCFLGPGCYRDLEDHLRQYLVSYAKVPVAVVLNNEVYAAHGIELRRSLRIRVMPVADIGQMAQFILDCDVPGSSSGTQKDQGVIAVVQFKGGVGGSTVAGGLAGCWARNNLRVALIDLDDVNPHLTDWARVGASQRRLIAETIREGKVAPYQLRELGFPVEGFDGRLVVFGQPEHYGESFHFKADVIENAPSIAGYVSSLIGALQGEFDVVVIDAGRSWGISTFAALPLCQRILTVIDDDQLSLRRTLDNFLRIYRESDDPAEFDLGKWSFVLNAFTERVLSLPDVVEELETLDVFPEKIDLRTLPYSDRGREWGLGSLCFYDLAEQGARNMLCDLAYSLVPFQYEAPVIQLYDRLRRGFGKKKR
ncbi:MAG: hypothetical protein U0136_11850 [Bdellovibrionota bacterium]